MPNAESVVVESILKIIELGKDRLESDRIGRIIGFERGAFFLDQEGKAAYDETLKRMMRLGKIGEKFSEKYVEKWLNSAIESALDDPKSETVAGALARFLDEAEKYDTEQTVYLPVLGLELSPDELELGAVTLMVLRGKALDELREAGDAVINSTLETDESKQRLRQKSADVITAEFAQKTVSRYRVVAEQGRALERATEETRRALDLIRFSIPAFHSDSSSVSVGLPGDFRRAALYSIIISKKSYDFNWSMIGGKLPFRVDAGALEHMKKMGVFVLSDILRSPVSAVSEFDQALITSVHWFASGQSQSELENRFLNTVTSIETLLTPRDGNPIGTAIAEGVAILTATKLNVRRRIKRRMKELYDSRSKVSHGGSRAVLELDLAELQLFAGALLVRLIGMRDQFKKKKDLSEWLEDQRLGGSASESSDGNDSGGASVK